MTSLEIVDSIYFHGEELRLTTSEGELSVPISAIFSQTAAMLEDCSVDEARSLIDELVANLDGGIMQLETLEMGMRQQERRNAGY